MSVNIYSQICLLREPGGSDTPIAVHSTQILAFIYYFPLKGNSLLEDNKREYLDDFGYSNDF